MDIQRYLIRALKSTFLFFLLTVLIFVLTYIFGRSGYSDVTFTDLVMQSDVKQMILFFVIFGFVYPLIGFIKQKVHLNRPFEEDKEDIIRIFADLHFVLEKEEDKKLIFRHTGTMARITRMFEDRVTVDYSDNQLLIISGLRKDTYRLARTIQYFTRKSE